MTNVQRVDRLCNDYLRLRRGNVDREVFVDALRRNTKNLVASFKD